MAFPSTILSLAHAAGSNFLSVLFGGVTSHTDGLNEIIDDLIAVETVLGAGITSANGVVRKLGEVSGTGASGVLEIASIPATYRNLRVVIVGRSSAAVTTAGIRMTFETSPTATTYSHQTTSSSNTTLSAAENIGSSDFIVVGSVPGASSTATLIGAAQAHIFEYANTSVYKAVKSLCAGITNITSGGLADFTSSGNWTSTNAINRVRVTLSTGSWTALSRMTIYGEPG